MKRDQITTVLSIVALLSMTALRQPVACAPPEQAQGGIAYIETHVHLKADYLERGRIVWDFDAAAREAIRSMNELRIDKCLLMPPPFEPHNPTIYDDRKLQEVRDRYPERFAFLGGGGTLNPLIQLAVKEGASDEIREEFRERAQQIASAGAAGFGELTALHLSFRQGHSYEAAPPDHELFLLLADIAAEHQIPIDIHMEAVTHDMPLPGRFRSPPNPQHLTENIRGFERLLAHNRMARVVWAHVGWDNTGDATVELYDRLLAEHPNLYLQLKAYRDSNSENMILADGRIKPEWMRLIESHPDRFVLGSDNFYGIPDKTRPFPDSSMGSRMILRDLSPELARKVGVENARRMYRFNAPDPK